MVMDSWCPPDRSGPVGPRDPHLKAYNYEWGSGICDSDSFLIDGVLWPLIHGRLAQYVPPDRDQSDRRRMLEPAHVRELLFKVGGEGAIGREEARK